jgi:hypothetical protein
MSRLIFSALALFSIISWACGSSDGPQPITSLDQLSGSWIMLQDTALRISDTTQRLDLKGRDSIAWDTLAIASGGAGLNWFSSKAHVYVDTVTIALASGTLTLKFVRGGTPVLPWLHYQVTGSGNDMIWSGLDTLYVDFDNDSLLDPGRERIRWRRP